MTLNGWQAVTLIAIAGALGIAGAFVPNLAASTALFTMSTGIITGTFALLQARRDPTSRSRASDRIPTAAGGHPVTPPPQVEPFRR